MGFPVETRASSQVARGGAGCRPLERNHLWSPRAAVLGATVTLGHLCLCPSPAPVEMLSLKLRRPAFSDDIDLNATFDVDTPPARPPGLQHGHAKKLCPEKAQ